MVAETKIEINLNRLSQLFNSLDPSPFHERDLDQDAEDYIVGSAEEAPRQHPLRLVIHLPAEQLPHTGVPDLATASKDMWCIPQVDAEYVARMEDVLDLYAELPDPNRPVVCFDESRPSSLARFARRSRPSRASSSGTIANIDVMEQPICSCSSTSIGLGAR